MRRSLLMSLMMLGLAHAVSAQGPDRPIVAMTVETGGRVSELTAPESGMAHVTQPDGSVVGIRPTILDSKPWNRVALTLFKAPSKDAQPTELGTVEVKTGGPAVDSKAGPGYKVAVTRVTGDSTR